MKYFSIYDWPFGFVEEVHALQMVTKERHVGGIDVVVQEQSCPAGDAGGGATRYKHRATNSLLRYPRNAVIGSGLQWSSPMMTWR